MVSFISCLWKIWGMCFAAAAMSFLVTQLINISLRRLNLQCLTKWYFLLRDTNAHTEV